MKPFQNCLLFVLAVACSPRATENRNEKDTIRQQMERALKSELLDVWYPKAIDREHGGFLSTFSFDFKPEGNQDKMIVSQSRHVWNNAKAMQRFPQNDVYATCARHGFAFLRDVMWDSTYGGFHTLVSRTGVLKSSPHEEKTAYGNSFAIYSLAAYYAASGDTSALNLARKAFHWLEAHSHDPERKGYYQHMTRTGAVIQRTATTPGTAETGYKDQNSSIHLLEAFTELYQVWPDDLLRQRLEEMLLLIRDTIVQPGGYMALFFTPDWQPVTYRDSARNIVERHINLDHVSFGHDVETAYLMLEASHVLGHNGSTTPRVAKRMVDHALENGWDDALGGFYDAGYYFPNNQSITIVRDTKNWWTQAEGLNTLLMMAERYPEDDHRYFEKFVKLWNYTNTYLVDHDHGEWYSGGLDKEPGMKTAQKGHIWKAAYHQVRALLNCSASLAKQP